jgi:hypothetical protein
MPAIDMKSYYAQLLGGTIVATDYTKDESCYGDEGWPTLTVKLKSGEEWKVEVSRDPEGNGPGFLFMGPKEEGE